MEEERYLTDNKTRQRLAQNRAAFQLLENIRNYQEDTTEADTQMPFSTELRRSYPIRYKFEEENQDQIEMEIVKLS